MEKERRLQLVFLAGLYAHNDRNGVGRRLAALRQKVS